MAPDRYAAAVAVEYVSFLARITGAWLAARDTGADLRAIVALRNAGRAAARALLVNVDALGRTNATLLPGKIDKNALQAFLKALRSIAAHNVASLLANLRGAPSLSSVMTHMTGVFSRVLRLRASTPRFTAQDSAGRTWQADKLVAFLARDLAYNAMIDAQANAIAQAGVPAQVVYSDPLHRHYGVVVSPDGSDADLPTLASLRAALFHPNSRAMLRPYHGALHVSL